jgi:hypothetical protein
MNGSPEESEQEMNPKGNPEAIESYRFRKGQSGNPGGRARGGSLIAAIRSSCGQNGSSLIDALRTIAFGRPAERRP